MHNGRLAGGTGTAPERAGAPDDNGVGSLRPGVRCGLCEAELVEIVLGGRPPTALRTCIGCGARGWTIDTDAASLHDVIAAIAEWCRADSGNLDDPHSAGG